MAHATTRSGDTFDGSMAALVLIGGVCVAGLISQAQRGEAPNVATIGPTTCPPTLAAGTFSNTPKAVASDATDNNCDDDDDDGLDAEMAQAAKLIASSDELLQKKRPVLSDDTSPTFNPFSPEEHAAATQIQAIYRGYKVRQSLFEDFDGEASADDNGDDTDADSVEGDADRDTKAPTPATTWPSPDEPGGVGMTSGSIAERARRKQSGRMRNTKKRALRISQKLDDLLAESATDDAIAEETISMEDKDDKASTESDDERNTQAGESFTGAGHIQPIALAAKANVIAEPPQGEPKTTVTKQICAPTENKNVSTEVASAVIKTSTLIADAATPDGSGTAIVQEWPTVSPNNVAVDENPAIHSSRDVPSTVAVQSPAVVAPLPEPTKTHVGGNTNPSPSAPTTAEPPNAGNSAAPTTTAGALSSQKLASVVLPAKASDVKLRPQTAEFRARTLSSASRASIKIPGGLPPPPATLPPIGMERTMSDSVQGLQAQLRLAWEANDQLQTTVDKHVASIDGLTAQMRVASEEHEKQVADLRAQVQQKRSKKKKAGCTVA
jgi:hypothetical protein